MPFPVWTINRFDKVVVVYTVDSITLYFCKSQTICEIIEYNIGKGTTRNIAKSANKEIGKYLHAIQIQFAIGDNLYELTDFNTGKARTFKTKFERALNELITIGKLAS